MAITPEYQAYLHSNKWKSKRRKVLSRAKYKCEQCKKQQATQVHHKTYKRIFNERLNDLMAVCATCHMEIHDVKEKREERVYILYFGKKIWFSSIEKCRQWQWRNSDCSG